MKISIAVLLNHSIFWSYIFYVVFFSVCLFACLSVPFPSYQYYFIYESDVPLFTYLINLFLNCAM